jgi:hypothetical protein
LFSFEAKQSVKAFILFRKTQKAKRKNWKRNKAKQKIFGSKAKKAV